MKRIRLRRNRPSALAAALALMLTMFSVFLITQAAGSKDDRTASAGGYGTADIRMEGMQAQLEILGRYNSAMEAQVAAAQCLAGGGAGVIIPDGEGHAVVYAAHADADAYKARAGSEHSAQVVSGNGLTLRASGSAAQVAALQQAVDFLRTLAVQTGSLAASLESGGTDAGSMQALISVYLTQGRSAAKALSGFAGQDASAQALLRSVENSLVRLQGAYDAPNAGSLRRIYAAGRLEWIGLLNDLCGDYV